MIDLTEILLRALTQKSVWHPEIVSVELSRLIQLEGGYFDWSQATGEEWMSLDGIEHNPYALVWTHAPLAIIQPYVSNSIQAYLLQHNGVLIESTDWHAADYSIDPQAIRDHGVPLFWPLDPDDPTKQAFSILDMYDVTNN